MFNTFFQDGEKYSRGGFGPPVYGAAETYSFDFNLIRFSTVNEKYCGLKVSQNGVVSTSFFLNDNKSIVGCIAV